ncbi:Arc family DNA-binding protein [Serratia marcescens]|uniref:Arc family DNA-binding protein n=1 Tax=Serratia marcescens TaxID=615 RepID=UPI0012B56D51|nr:Arc family DNA-binding protein [Serratia marcescens]
MAKIQCRNFPDHLFEQLVTDAQKNERSLEGHVRFLLTDILNNPTLNEETELPEWMLNALRESAKKGFRSLRYEIIKRLTESLAAEHVYAPDASDKA